jgi:hypothetical protein
MQRGDEESSHRDGARTVALRGVSVKAPRDLDQVGADVDATTDEIEVEHPERRHLAELSPV